MARLLSNPIDNFDKIKCKYRYDNKNVKRVDLSRKIVSALLKI